MTNITGPRRTKMLRRMGIGLLVMGLFIIAGGASQYLRNQGNTGEAMVEASAPVVLVVALIIGSIVCGTGAISLLVLRAERRKAESD